MGDLAESHRQSCEYANTGLIALRPLYPFRRKRGPILGTSMKRLCAGTIHTPNWPIRSRTPIHASLLGRSCTVLPLRLHPRVFPLCRFGRPHPGDKAVAIPERARQLAARILQVRLACACLTSVYWVQFSVEVVGFPGFAPFSGYCHCSGTLQLENEGSVPMVVLVLLKVILHYGSVLPGKGALCVFSCLPFDLVIPITRFFH